MPVSEHTPLISPPACHSQQASQDSNASGRGKVRGLLNRIKSRVPQGQATQRLDNVLDDIDQDEQKSKRFLWFALFCIFNHVVGGAITLHFLEGWSLYDAFYFCIVTTTTVGYGDITPSRVSSKLYVVYYVVVSIGLITALLSHLVSVLLDRQEAMLLAALTGEDAEEIDEYDSDIEAPTSGSDMSARILHATRHLDLSDYYGLFYSVLSLLLILGIGVVVFTMLEKLSFVDAVYTTIISATTVGFGDFEPTQNGTKVIMTFWLGFSTMCVAKVVADFTDATMKARQRAMSRRLLTASMDLNSMKQMDADKSGSIDKSEFLTEMLVRSGKVDRREIDTILLRFNQLDTNSSGDITASECVA